MGGSEKGKRPAACPGQVLYILSIQLLGRFQCNYLEDFSVNTQKIQNSFFSCSLKDKLSCQCNEQKVLHMPPSVILSVFPTSYIYIYIRIYIYMYVPHQKGKDSSLERRPRGGVGRRRSPQSSEQNGGSRRYSVYLPYWYTSTDTDARRRRRQHLQARKA